MYNDIYAALYEWNLKQWSGDDYVASFLTAAGLAGAVGMNIVLAIMVIRIAAGPLPPAPKWLFFLIPITLIMLHYNAFVRHDRYASMVRRFRTRPDAERRRVAAIAWTYVVASFGLPMAFAFLMAAVTQQ
jgi:hypothetical protein